MKVLEFHHDSTPLNDQIMLTNVTVTVIEQFILGITRYSDGWRRVVASE